ncbi:hypothetical protein ACU4GD_23545 [Cupriavidus basilensis]
MRKTSDLHIPGYARGAALRNSQPLPDGESSEAYGRLPNTSSQQQGGSLGWNRRPGPTAGDRRQNHSLSTTTHTARRPRTTMRLQMHQQRFALEGEARNLDGQYRRLDRIGQGAAGFSYTDYEHKEEIGGGQTGTIFKNNGWDARFEAKHGAHRQHDGRDRHPVRFDPLLRRSARRPSCRPPIPTMPRCSSSRKCRRPPTATSSSTWAAAWTTPA